ncbi:MAG: hypothetical protein KBD17_02955 [Candidatus Pacebacteria bacterium]|nr:hypothetical protein [Candidatus Paceibacterota bacterium]
MGIQRIHEAETELRRFGEVTNERGGDVNPIVEAGRRFYSDLEKRSANLRAQTPTNRFDVDKGGAERLDAANPIDSSIAYLNLESNADTPESPERLIELTFGQNGAFDKIKVILEKSSLTKSLEALEVIEAAMLRIFTEPQKPESVTGLASRVWTRTLLITGNVVQSADLIRKGQRRLAKAIIPTALLPTNQDGDVNYPNEISDIVLRAADKNHRDSGETKELTELRRKLEALTPLFNGFRAVLANEIHAKEQKQEFNTKTPDLLKMLTTREGMVLALSRPKRDSGPSKTLFELVPEVISDKTDHLTEFTDFDPKQPHFKLDPLKSYSPKRYATPYSGVQDFFTFDNKIIDGDRAITEINCWNNFSIFNARLRYSRAFETPANTRRFLTYIKVEDGTTDEDADKKFNFTHHALYLDKDGNLFIKIDHVKTEREYRGSSYNKAFLSTGSYDQIDCLKGEYDEMYFCLIGSRTRALAVKIDEKYYCTGRQSDNLF